MMGFILQEGKVIYIIEKKRKTDKQIVEKKYKKEFIK